MSKRGIAARKGLTQRLLVRVTEEMLTRLDALVAKQDAASPDRVVTRSMVARSLLHAALASERQGPA